MHRARAGVAVAVPAAIALVAVLFAGWFTVRATGPQATNGGDLESGGGILNLLNTYDPRAVHATGWDVLGGLALTPLLAAFAVALVLPLTRRVALAAALLGTVTVVVLALRVHALGDDPRGARVTVEAPAYLAVACAAALAAGAWAARPGRGT
jgi:hypothetical protein